MQYVRKIFYMDLYDGDRKIRNCGYVKMETMQSKTYFYFYLNEIPDIAGDELTVYIFCDRNKVTFEHIKVKDSSVCEVVMLSNKIAAQQIDRIAVQLSDQQQIQYMKSCVQKEVEPKRTDNEVVVRENIPLKVSTSNILGANEADNADNSTLESKWEQLKQMFPVISVFGNEAETLLLNPKDLVVLPEEYHNLATNSFLMHGYYNYRQLLLTRWNSHGEYQYYIGVPGNFYDREKSVARMFGFEGFENGESSRRQVHATEENISGENTVYPGCFGYYMKKVSI